MGNRNSAPQHPANRKLLGKQQSSGKHETSSSSQVPSVLRPVERKREALHQPCGALPYSREAACHAGACAKGVCRNCDELSCGKVHPVPREEEPSGRTQLSGEETSLRTTLHHVGGTKMNNETDFIRLITGDNNHAANNKYRLSEEVYRAKHGKYPSTVHLYIMRAWSYIKLYSIIYLPILTWILALLLLIVLYTRPN